MIYLNAFSWMTPSSYGNSHQAFKSPEESRESLYMPERDSILINKVPNWGRFDDNTRKACLGAGLALKDLGLAQDSQKHKIGLIAFGEKGSNNTDRDYFLDFLDHGESTGRSHLFIYTLPTSPFAEAAIYFGLMGPIYYLSGRDSILQESLQSAARMILSANADQMIVGTVEKDSLFMVLGPRTQNSLCALKDLPNSSSSSEMIRELQKIQR